MMPLSKFAERAFEAGCAPRPETLRQMVKDGDVPGFQDARGRWWVDFEAFERKLSDDDIDPILDDIRKSA